MHFHIKKHETFCILSGIVKMSTIKDGIKEEVIMLPLDVIVVPPGLMHQFEAQQEAEILEVSTTHYEEDSYRVYRGDQCFPAS